MIKSMLARVRQRFPLSAAEVGQHEIFNSSEFGFCSVGTDSAQLERLAEKCRSHLERDFPVEFYQEEISVESY